MEQMTQEDTHLFLEQCSGLREGAPARLCGEIRVVALSMLHEGNGPFDEIKRLRKEVDRLEKEVQFLHDTRPRGRPRNAKKTEE